ncbi:conserved hypothetical protein [Flavobacterium psychrophilum]|uniref:hypothetical protein n=1 Tax=Flavobacterium psychrophilum TaxID=96345 RepID=UPI000B7C234B|nr:hypothetical protein [Flavobacterium psychrophilum]SNA83426.1 conserved hypothetical protein [Flavobacterium psychrophilum]
MRKDILLDTNFDLLIENGDFVIGDSDQQHVNCVFLAHQGEYKEFPKIGFGASNYLKKSKATKEKFIYDLTKQLKYDGYTEAEITNDFENLIITI